MTPDEVRSQLEGIADLDDFPHIARQLVEGWKSQDARVETVEPVLRFIESHPDIDFGSPGPLVHFVERFYLGGYEEALVESVLRQPRAHTVWMLNRLINGTTDVEVRTRYIGVMKAVGLNPAADDSAVRYANQFLERLR
ncbi:MAG TPA: hypothetical protein VFB69_05540 [Candidatus Dormibacteraeota bacterium]|nr:hypothetical protein [Candidatus Dormibacteraeota bacterium]